MATLRNFLRSSIKFSTKFFSSSTQKPSNYNRIKRFAPICAVFVGGGVVLVSYLKSRSLIPVYAASGSKVSLFL